MSRAATMVRVFIVNNESKASFGHTAQGYARRDIDIRNIYFEAKIFSKVLSHTIVVVPEVEEVRLLLIYFMQTSHGFRNECEKHDGCYIIYVESHAAGSLVDKSVDSFDLSVGRHRP